MDYNQLKLIYEKIYSMSLEIENLIDTNNYEELLPTVTRRDKLTLQLEDVRKSFPKVEDYPAELQELIATLKAQELKNMERLELLKQGLRKELEKVNKNTKIMSAYAPNTAESSIIDITE